MSKLSEAERTTRLSKLLNDVVFGKQTLTTSHRGSLFIEAICVQADPSSCLHKLAKPNGLKAVQNCVRSDTSLKFIEENTTKLLKYLQFPDLQHIEGGSILATILISMVDPPFFWDAFTKEFRANQLSSDARQVYAWLLLQLIQLPTKNSAPFKKLASATEILDPLLKSAEGLTRNLGQMIKHLLALDATDLCEDMEVRPGGRHNNDHADYRAISIMPTVDELLSKERPFLRTIDFFDETKAKPSLEAMHKDNQFRLLREDMMSELREEIQILTGTKVGRRKGIIIDDLQLVDLEMGDNRKRVPWGIKLRCKQELPHLKHVKPEKRLTHLERHPQIMRHRNISCLLSDGEPVAFPTIHRNNAELARTSATITVQLSDDLTLPYALSKLRTTTVISLVQLNTAVFAYESFLKRLQQMSLIPLSKHILHWANGDLLEPLLSYPRSIVQRLQGRENCEIKDIIETAKSVQLDESQIESLCASLSQPVSLVQGPPGTGKSFIGALTVKVIHDHSTQNILVICFTNHAIDQFLEDLLDIGIPPERMVRLGSKSTARTNQLLLRGQGSSRLNPSQAERIQNLKNKLADYEARLYEVFQRYHANIQKHQLMEHLEFASENLPFFQAFELPPQNDGMTHVGPYGKPISSSYLLDRWIRGMNNAGQFQQAQSKATAPVWNMNRNERRQAQINWEKAIREDIVAEIARVGQEFNEVQAQVNHIFSQREANVIKGKRIIACTTNGAATYAAAIQAACPEVVLVEEAGEILESHILTAMGPHTKQLILIGDHQQLRPKCSYELGVEGGHGYDLNRSLFERQVLKGYPHVTLTKQHRMRPEISSIIRHMTYAGLTDAKSTMAREDLLGFDDNVMFIDHRESETEILNSRELRDKTATSSKQNAHEAQMILKCVKYLAQQGYRSSKIVVLTPYLGQLRLLQEILSEENDPILNDMDRHDLVSAGLLPEDKSKNLKPSLRMATIDNYQGEESDIVLISLTRSNASHDIGFLSSPERLNVLVSRARNAMILVGNSETFLNARKGKELWKKFIHHLTDNGHFYRGFPMKCEKHPSRKVLLSKPEDFGLYAPDGGCTEPCGVLLNCKVHKCPSSCHQLINHSQMKCVAIMTDTCSKGHRISWKCHTSPTAVPICTVCETQRKTAENQARKDLAERQRKDQESQKHLQKLARIQNEIDKANQELQDDRIDKEREGVLAQKMKDLAVAKQKAASTKNAPSKHADPQSSPEVEFQTARDTQKQTELPSLSNKTERKLKLKEHLTSVLDHNISPSKTEWQRQKDQEGCKNSSIDAIMEMIGLEDVKSQVLKIKSKVETSIRQDTDLTKERLGLVLLGNPGTGKTTVARHYAKILTSLKVLAGDGFVETTGSRLAQGGVTEVKSHLKGLEEGGGGVYFIDEAYQLAEGHNYGGKQVLDYLLAEIENLTGKIVFVFAGYRKQMEKFFEHNPGFASRIPYVLRFEDYNDTELLRMLRYNIDKYYKSAMEVEDGKSGLYMRIAVRRLGRGRGRDGFGNARALENLFARIRERQSDRLTQDRRAGLSPDDYYMAKEDLIGPDPSKAILNCAAWNKLQKLTGLRSVKESVKFLIDNITTNYKRELQEKSLIEVPLNRVFLGSPGTGKTTVAKLYGRILADIGLLSNGEGSAMGQSEANTKAILATTVGKVLIIDEAYMLYTSNDGSGGNNSTDIYKTAVIDTIVAEVQSTPGEDRCVLLLGYEDQMLEMFQNVNPGLTRRFRLNDAFHFEDFNNSELQEILALKLKDQDLAATDKAISVAIDILDRARNGLNFGNGGDVENLISTAKINFQTRQSSLPAAQRSIDFLFEPQDFDPNFDRASGAQTNLQELFKDVIGCETIIEKLAGYLRVAKGMRAQGLEPRGQIPMNFIFKGPPGTGKTTTARKFGQVFYDLGFLSQVEVIECSATDLIGQYVGQTGPKTIKQLERGLGKILFIDEAYRLGEGLFAQEAVNELVDSMTKPRFAGKLVVILAGYDNDMNNLLKVNEGLSSRFADEVLFPPLSAEHCIRLLQAKLRESRIIIAALQEESFYSKILVPLTELCKLSSWGNARDVQTLAKRMVRLVYETSTVKVDQLDINGDKALQCVHAMLDEKRKRESAVPETTSFLPGAVQQLDPRCQAPPSVKFNSTHHAATEISPQEPEAEPTEPAQQPETNAHTRDAGVSNEVWAQLQLDKHAAELQDKRSRHLLNKQEESFRAAVEVEKRIASELTILRDMQAKDETEAHKIALKREEARIRELKAQTQREKIQRELVTKKKAEMERQKLEKQAQVKLRQLGVCSMGFQWVKQTGGYRCSAGGHFVTDRQLRL